MKTRAMKYAAAPALAASLMFAGCNVNDEAHAPSESSLAAAALTTSKKADIILYDNNASKWSIAASNGSAFVPSSATWLTYNIGTGYDVLSGDVNNDGKDDLILRNRSNTQVLVATSTGIKYNTPKLWLSPWVSSGYQIMAADLNGDHKVDLIGKNKSSGTWKVALNTGTTFSDKGTWLEKFADGAFDVFAANLNGNSIGRGSVIAHDRTTGKLYVATSDGAEFMAPVQRGTAIPSGTGTAFLMADVTGDSSPDFIAKTNDGTWIVYPWNGTSFSAGKTWGTGFAVGTGYTLYAADVNGDGKADLVAKDKSTASTPKWFVFPSDGTKFVNGAVWLTNFGFGTQFTTAIGDPTGN